MNEYVFIRCVKEKERQDSGDLSKLVGRVWNKQPTLKDANECFELAIILPRYLELSDGGYIPVGMMEAFERASIFNALYRQNPIACLSMQGPWISCALDKQKWPETLLTVQPALPA